MPDHLSHISTIAWSDIKESDYSIEQWHRACLIHQHDGAPTSKSQCKLPVRTPNGAVNRNGVHAAAAVLAGARGGVNASRAEKDAAEKAVISLYKELDEQLPKFLVEHAEGKAFASDFLLHYGIRGMKWGRRKDKGNSAVKGDDGEISDDAAKARELAGKVKSGGTKALSNQELQHLVNRINLEQNFARITTPQAQKTNPMKKGVQVVGKKMGKYGEMYVDTMVKMKMTEDIKDRFGSRPKAA